LRDFDYDAAANPASDRRHVFTFVEALGNWTHASGNLATGTSTATNATGGLLGGLGWRGDNAMISLFGGGIHGQQTIAALGTQTLAHSSLFGVNALVRRNGFDASATVAYDNGTGDTTRALPDGTTTWSSYGLRAMVADLALGYTFHEWSGWAMRPQIGLTHITTHRDGADELGSTAFELHVDGERRKLDFADASWRIAPPTTAASRFSPWVSVGFRVRLDGDNPQATGFLPDASDPIVADGVLRARTVATFKAGFSFAVSPAATFYGSFDGERGSGGNNNALNGGIRLAF
jgi:outer membrane autotransporter protein